MTVELVGTAEIAALAKVERNTVNVWKQRGLLPAPLAVLSCGVIWDKQTIEAWLANGRVDRRRRP